MVSFRRSGSSIFRRSSHETEKVETPIRSDAPEQHWKMDPRTGKWMVTRAPMKPDEAATMIQCYSRRRSARQSFDVVYWEYAYELQRQEACITIQRHARRMQARRISTTLRRDQQLAAATAAALKAKRQEEIAEANRMARRMERIEEVTPTIQRNVRRWLALRRPPRYSRLEVIQRALDRSARKDTPVFIRPSSKVATRRRPPQGSPAAKSTSDIVPRWKPKQKGRRKLRPSPSRKDSPRSARRASIQPTGA